VIQGSIQEKEAFLNVISSKLGRSQPSNVQKPNWRYRPQWEVYKDQSQDEILEIFIKSCERQGTKVALATSSTLVEHLSNMIEAFGGGPLIASSDGRFEEHGLESFLKEKGTFFWNLRLGDYNIEQAKQANIGLSFSDRALAESGTTVFYHNKENARSISLLPKISIVIVYKSSIVPRLTQALKEIGDRVKAGEQIESYINMVSGPSNSADIEMNMVVGVHGPIKVGYLILEDKK
jgi:L-lactate dehydrogenase complex protein LldG